MAFDSLLAFFLLQRSSEERLAALRRRVHATVELYSLALAADTDPRVCEETDTPSVLGKRQAARRLEFDKTVAFKQRKVLCGSKSSTPRSKQSASNDMVQRMMVRREDARRAEARRMEEEATRLEVQRFESEMWALFRRHEREERRRLTLMAMLLAK